jgi:hypothetical protein
MKSALPHLELHNVMYFDPETIALLQITLDRAWASLPERQQVVTSRSILADAS